MSSSTRQARVKAFAKLNLTLEVLGRRSDGYHDLRTIFQTISLFDELDIRFTPSRTSKVVVESSVEIADNLIAKAAQVVVEETNAKGQVLCNLSKRFLWAVDWVAVLRMPQPCCLLCRS